MRVREQGFFVFRNLYERWRVYACYGYADALRKPRVARCVFVLQKRSWQGWPQAPRCIPRFRHGAGCDLAAWSDMARPRKKQDDHRRNFIGFRVTDDELAMINQRASAAGVLQSEFMRQVATSGRVRYSRRVTTDPVVIAELNRIGVNLNQLTKTANSVGKVPPASISFATRSRQSS